MPIPPPSDLLGGAGIWNISPANTTSGVQVEDYDFRALGPKLDFVRYEFKGPAKFLRCTFPETRLNDSTFIKGGDFSDCIFEGDCFFTGCATRGNDGLNFRSAKFRGIANFQQVVADGGLGFEGIEAESLFLLHVHSSAPILVGKKATFHAGAVISGSYAEAIFPGAKFKQSLECSGAQFERDVDFGGCEFDGDLLLVGRIGGPLDLSHATVKGFATFKAVQFDGDVNLKNARFERHANFDAGNNESKIPSLSAESATFVEGCSFNGRAFGGDTSFRAATFGFAPELHNCELFPATEFANIKLSDWRSSQAEACYRSLRQACNKIEDHHGELFFFSQEMRAKRAKEEGRALKVAYGLYESLSNYGLSVWLPLRAFGVLLGGAFLVYGLLDLLSTSNLRCIKEPGCSLEFQWAKAEAIGSFALAQAVPFVPAVKDAAGRPNVLWQSQPVLQLTIEFVAVVHAIASVVLLFLVVLGLRNQFRLS